MNVGVAWQHSGFKAKADINRNIAVSIRRGIEGYGYYVFGVGIWDVGRGNRV